MADRFVFVVGLPRTGSKLVVNVLERSAGPRVHITPETFFLGRAFGGGARRWLPELRDLSSAARVEALLDRLYSGSVSVFPGDFWAQLADGRMGIERSRLESAVLCSERTPRGLYSALLRSQKRSPDDALLGDKTGPHLYRVPTLLSWFPEARVIHMIRDPRAILASEQQRRVRRARRRARQRGKTVERLSRELLEPALLLASTGYVALAWRRAARLHERHRARYPDRYLGVRFEDLVARPESTVPELCRFVGVPFDPAMLDPPRIDSSFGPRHGHGFDAETLQRWRGRLSPWQTRLLERALEGPLARLGYG